MSVSVVLALHDQASLVMGALLSVWRSLDSRTPVQLVVVDDASNDNSFAVARALAGRDWFLERFADIRIEAAESPLGPAGALNLGVSRTDGDRILLLDPADRFLGDRITAMALQMNETGAALAVSEATSIALEASSKPKLAMPEFSARLRAYAEDAKIDVERQLTPYNLAFSRRIFDKIGGFRDLTFYFGWDFVARAAAVEPILWVEGLLYGCGHLNANLDRMGDLLAPDLAEFELELSRTWRVPAELCATPGSIDPTERHRAVRNMLQPPRWARPPEQVARTVSIAVVGEGAVILASDGLSSDSWICHKGRLWIGMIGSGKAVSVDLWIPEKFGPRVVLAQSSAGETRVAFLEPGSKARLTFDPSPLSNIDIRLMVNGAGRGVKAADARPLGVHLLGVFVR